MTEAHGLAICITGIVAACTVIVYIGNGHSLVNDREQGGTWWLIVAWIVVAAVWAWAVL
jgi:hypothetical protein